MALGVDFIFPSDKSAGHFLFSSSLVADDGVGQYSAGVRSPVQFGALKGKCVVTWVTDV